MRNFISSTKGKLDDPIMQEWAIHFYSDLPNNAHAEKSQIETDWFHELFVAQLIKGGDKSLLGQFFRALPPQHFSSFTQLIVKNWTNWPASLVTSAAPILATNAPDDLMELFKKDLAQLKTGNIVDPLRFLSIDQLAIENTNATQFINEFSLVVLRLNDDFAQSILIDPLFKHRKALSTDTVEKLITKALDIESSEDRRKRHFESLFIGLFGSCEYLEMVYDKETFDLPLKLATLAAFFVDSAPLKQLDIWLDQLPNTEDIYPLLENISSESDSCYLLLGLLKKSKQLSEKLRSQLALAACLHGLSKDSIDVIDFDLTETVGLLAIDLNNSKWTDLLINHLKSFEPSAISPLLIQHLQQKDVAYFGAVHATKAMGELKCPEFISPLINAISSDSGDFLCEAALESLLKIGVEAQTALIEQWDSLDSSQRIFGQSLIKNIHSKTASDFIVSRFSELMSFDMELACELITATPDLRLLELLKPELRREQTLIDSAFYISSRLLGYTGQEVDAAKEHAFADHLRSQQAMDALDSGSMPQKDHLHLELKCPACDSVNQYKTKGVIVSTEANVPYLLADEFPCVSCNKQVDFIFTSMAMMAVTAELITNSVNKNSAHSQTAKVRTSNCRLDGKTIPLAIALSSLQKDLAKKPDNALKWFQFGNLITQINRPKATVDAYNKAVDYAPTAVDAKFALAITLADNLQEAKAFSILQFALKQLPEWTFLSDFPDFGQTFADLYNHLRRSLGKLDIPAVHPSSLGKPKKLGRNEPCSCGSGKKFKKCCGR